MRKALLPLLIATIPVIAQPIFSYKDSHGNIVYTNQQPPANSQAEEVKLPKIQTMSTEQLKQELTQDKSNTIQTKEKQPSISEVIINGIPTEEALRSNNGTFTISASLSTANGVTSLPPNYQYTLLLDNNLYAGPQTSSSFTLTSIDRGTHTIQIQVVKGGQLIASSRVETFTLQRSISKSSKIHPRNNK